MLTFNEIYNVTNLMKIAVFNEKGGSGKTTLSVTLALALGIELIDLDSQKSATYWLGDEPRKLISNGWIADCPPGLEAVSADVIELLGKADLVLIPVKPSFTDLRSLPQTVRFLKIHAKSAKIAFVGSTVDKRSTDAETLKEALAGYGYPIAGMLSQRASYRRAGLSSAQAGDSDAIAAAEAETLIQFIQGVPNGN